jgi:hypothetical protein
VDWLYGVAECSMEWLSAVWSVDWLSAVWSVDWLSAVWSVGWLNAVWSVGSAECDQVSVCVVAECSSGLARSIECRIVVLIQPSATSLVCG